MPARRYQAIALVLITLLAAADLAVNLLLLNPGEPDMVTLLGFARGLVQYGAWPGNPYFPPGYPLLLIPFGYLGSMLVGGCLLSAAGLWLALWATHNLLIAFEVPRLGALTAVVLGWLLPATRVTFSTPYVDALFAGLAVWFIAAALSYLQRSGAARAGVGSNRLPIWAITGLLVPALLLPLLRNHAPLVVLPVLVVLLAWRRKWWYLLAASAVLFVAAIVFNLFSYRIAYGEAQPSVWQTYYRVGLELDYNRFFPTDEEIGISYLELAKRSREVPLLADYSLQEIAVHTARQFWLFLRRPAIGLALLLALLASLPALRRRLRQPLPREVTTAAWWALSYILALSPAYFTARSAALVALVCLAVAAAVISRLATDWLRRLAWVLLCAGLLLLSALYFPYRFYIGHYRNHLASQAAQRYVSERGLSYQQVVCSGIVLLPLADNPWAEHFASIRMGWHNDPVIRPEQRALPRLYDLDRLARGQGELPQLYICPFPPVLERNLRITQSPAWRLIDRFAGVGIYAPTKSPADQAAGAK
jgi:hypothetical protein